MCKLTHLLDVYSCERLPANSTHAPMSNNNKVDHEENFFLFLANTVTFAWRKRSVFCAVPIVCALLHVVCIVKPLCIFHPQLSSPEQVIAYCCLLLIYCFALHISAWFVRCVASLLGDMVSCGILNTYTSLHIILHASLFWCSTVRPQAQVDSGFCLLLNAFSVGVELIALI